MRLPKPLTAILFVFCVTIAGFAQQTNPVDRQVANPITDTPNINPISAEQRITAPKTKKTSFDQDRPPQMRTHMALQLHGKAGGVWRQLVFLLLRTSFGLR